MHRSPYPHHRPAPILIQQPVALRHLAVGLLAFQTLALLDRGSARAAETQAAPERDVIPPAEVLVVDTDLSVRIPPTPDIVTCPRCSARLFAGGPTGFQGDDPICDACLLEAAPELGMVLVLVAMARLFGGPPPTKDEGGRVSLVELGAFARVYERFAAERSPTRGLGSFLRQGLGEA